MNNMKIDQLPVELLMKVFSFMPICAEISLVNKHFYGITRKLSDPNIRLQITSQRISKHLHSMQTSQREITCVGITDYFMFKERSSYISIIGNFSESIKWLTLSLTQLDESTLLEILSLTPNLENLKLFLCSMNEPLQPPGDWELNLNKLKTLSIDACDRHFIDVFLRLPVGVVTNLRINCNEFDWKTLAILLNRQMNIKHLVLKQTARHGRDHDELATDIFDQLKLETLSLGELNSVATAAILQKQTKLKSLTLYDEAFARNVAAAVDDHVMDAVANLTELQTLAIDVAGTPVLSFMKIRKLKNVKDLTIRNGGIDCRAILSVFAESDNSSLNTLTLNGCLKMSTGVLRALAKSAPNLRHLTIMPDHGGHGSTVDNLLTQFNFVQSIEIRNFRIASADGNDFHNPKLEELTFDVVGAEYALYSNKFIDAYPNLKRLNVVIRSNLNCGPLRIRPLLDGLQKLEFLKIETCGVIVEDLDYLQDYKANLKFVALGELDGGLLTNEYVQKLRANFEVLFSNRTSRQPFSKCFLSMAVDRYTMNCENAKYLRRKTLPQLMEAQQAHAPHNHHTVVSNVRARILLMIVFTLILFILDYFNLLDPCPFLNVAKLGTLKQIQFMS